MTFKDYLGKRTTTTLAPPIPNTVTFSLHSALRSHSLTPEHAGYTTDTKRGKKGTEVISHTNQKHKMILSLCTMFYR